MKLSKIEKIILSFLSEEEHTIDRIFAVESDDLFVKVEHTVQELVEGLSTVYKRKNDNRTKETYNMLCAEVHKYAITGKTPLNKNHEPVITIPDTVPLENYHIVLTCCALNSLVHKGLIQSKVNKKTNGKYKTSPFSWFINTRGTKALKESLY